MIGFRSGIPLEQVSAAAPAASPNCAAELLEMPWLELRSRFLRLDVPLRAAPTDAAEARADADTLADMIAQGYRSAVGALDGLL